MGWGKIMKRLFFLCLVFAVFGCGAVAASSLDEAYKFYLLDDTVSSIRAVLEVSRDNPSAEAYYLLGLNYLKGGEYIHARNEFRKAINEKCPPALRDKAFVKIGDAFFLEGDLVKAEGAYRHVLKKSPKTTLKPHIYLRLAQISAREGNWTDKQKYIKLINIQISV